MKSPRSPKPLKTPKGNKKWEKKGRKGGSGHSRTPHETPSGNTKSEKSSICPKNFFQSWKCILLVFILLLVGVIVIFGYMYIRLRIENEDLVDEKDELKNNLSDYQKKYKAKEDEFNDFTEKNRILSVENQEMEVELFYYEKRFDEVYLYYIIN